MHERLVANVKKLELMIKEQRRVNEKMKLTIADKRAECLKQYQLTERIHAFEAQ